jgi:hypothetical protein
VASRDRALSAVEAAQLEALLTAFARMNVRPRQRWREVVTLAPVSRPTLITLASAAIGAVAHDLRSRMLGAIRRAAMTTTPPAAGDAYREAVRMTD